MYLIEKVQLGHIRGLRVHNFLDHLESLASHMRPDIQHLLGGFIKVLAKKIDKTIIISVQNYDIMHNYVS